MLDEPTRAGRYIERSVGIFQCTRCGTTFPHVVGNRRLAIVDADKYVQLKAEVEELRAENSRLKEDADVANLEASVGALEQEINALKGEKKELEGKLSQDSGSLDQVP